MYDASGTVIYVGKAKDLKKRLSSYFRANLPSKKTEALVSAIASIDVTVTHTETEALLLEH
ncbi:MAG: GIY-YIG nuclease family protein, partial [Plesiomonas sp.]